MPGQGYFIGFGFTDLVMHHTFSVQRKVSFGPQGQQLFYSFLCVFFEATSDPFSIFLPAQKFHVSVVKLAEQQIWHSLLTLVLENKSRATALSRFACIWEVRSKFSSLEKYFSPLSLSLQSVFYEQEKRQSRSWSFLLSTFVALVDVPLTKYYLQLLCLSAAFPFAPLTRELLLPQRPHRWDLMASGISLQVTVSIFLSCVSGETITPNNSACVCFSFPCVCLLEHILSCLDCFISFGGIREDTPPLWGLMILGNPYGKVKGQWTIRVLCLESHILLVPPFWFSWSVPQ